MEYEHLKKKVCEIEALLAEVKLGLAAALEPKVQPKVQPKVETPVTKKTLKLKKTEPSQESQEPFRELSIKMNNTLTKEERKKGGIFFTPKKARDLLFEKLAEFGVTPQSILEPSFGSGEFLEDCSQKYPEATLYGVEFNETLFKASKMLAKLHKTHQDFMKYKNGRVDLVVGNPPYFVDNKLKNPKCMIGRPNIYVAFLYKCLEEHLNDGGFLGFVLPTSLFNSSYYEPMRKYIADKCTIRFVKELDVQYFETEQDTMLIIIEKTPCGLGQTPPYILKRNGMTYICPFYQEVNKLLEGTKTLSELGFTVKTGDVVWNQEKTGTIGKGLDENGNEKKGREKLCDEGAAGAKIVIYSTNIVGNKIVLNNIKDKKGEKKQYIKDFDKPMTKGPAILINRGYGNVEYALQYAVTDLPEFYAENHINMILPKNKAAASSIPAITKSLSDPRTKQFIDWFVGNGAMSKTELEQVLPVFI